MVWLKSPGGAASMLFVVVPVSSSRAPSALRPRMSPEEGIDGESAAVCRGIRAVSRSRLLRPIGQLRPETMREVEQAVAMILGIRPSALGVSDGQRGHGTPTITGNPPVANGTESFPRYFGGPFLLKAVWECLRYRRGLRGAGCERCDALDRRKGLCVLAG
jgi:mRNA interferase MazF